MRKRYFICCGINHALGTDLDPNAIIASEENAQQNDIAPEKLEVIEGNIIDDKAVQDRCGYECYDVVCANILADFWNKMEDDHVSELEIVEINHDGEWVNITARKRGI